MYLSLMFCFDLQGAVPCPLQGPAVTRKILLISRHIKNLKSIKSCAVVRKSIARYVFLHLIHPQVRSLYLYLPLKRYINIVLEFYYRLTATQKALI